MHDSGDSGLALKGNGNSFFPLQTERRTTNTTRGQGLRGENRFPHVKEEETRRALVAIKNENCLRELATARHSRTS